MREFGRVYEKRKLKFNLAVVQLEWGTGTSDVKLGLQELEYFKYLVSADDGNKIEGVKILKEQENDNAGKHCNYYSIACIRVVGTERKKKEG